jgi:hypothetical protein
MFAQPLSGRPGLQAKFDFLVREPNIRFVLDIGHTFLWSPQGRLPIRISRVQCIARRSRVLPKGQS